MRCALIKYKLDLLRVCEKGISNKNIDNLLIFWENKVRKNLKGFSKNQDILTLIDDMDRILENLEEKKNKKNKKKLTLKLDFEEKDEYIPYKTEGNFSNFKTSSKPVETKPKPNLLRKSIFSNISASGPMFVIPSSKNMEAFQNLSPTKYMIYGAEEQENQKEEHEIYANRLNSSKNVNRFEFHTYNNNEDEEGNNNTKTFFRFSSKKSATLNLNRVNTLELKFFNYQEEQKDNNFIMKTKLSKTFVNFIDIDLFLQYIALEKNFFEKEEDNKNLIEGFCLQYQTFMFPENLVNKIISCFNYFYSRYLNQDDDIIEEKVVDGKEEKDNNNENNENKKNDFKIRSSFDDTVKKIPFKLIDFLFTFIKLHNTYYHIELSDEVITKINDFLKYLTEIYEVTKKYEQILQLSEIELKEYSASIIKFTPTVHKTSIDGRIEETIEEKLNSSEDSSDKEENKKVNLQKRESNNINLNSKASNLNNFYQMNNTRNKLQLKAVKTFKPFKTLNLNLDDDNKIQYIETETNERKKTNDKFKKNKKNKKDINKPYEFDILQYSTHDIASELTRVNYILYSKIKLKEFLKGVFNGKDKYKSSPHICQIVNRFNKLSYFVVEEILAYDHAEKRAEILLKFIKICKFLMKIGNFDDCLCIMTGLINYNISKLNKTWGHIPSEEMTNFRQLKKILSFEDNWKYLRKEIQKKIDNKSFYIPYLGYYTKRMLYLEEMGPYIKKNTSLINLEKIVEVYKVIKDFHQIKNVKFRYSIDESIKKELSILQCLDPSNEDFLVQTSNLLEPKFILSNKKLKIKRRTKTDINFMGNVNKFKLL